VDDRCLQLLEFDRIARAVAAKADSARARACLEAWRPLDSPAAIARENERLHEAIGRQAEPGSWCAVGEGELLERLDPRSEALDGAGLRAVATWLEAGATTRAAWSDPDLAARYPALSTEAAAIPDLAGLARRITHAIEPDGRVSDAASPALKRARADFAVGERRLMERLEKWARPHGEAAYVTRRGDRFVAMVPAAGFPRSGALVHDVSGSGQSLFVEPLEFCEANNRLIETRALIGEEERRIVLELGAAVRAETGVIETLDAALVAFDALRARARWAEALEARAIAPGGDAFRLRAARHPLLATGRDREKLIPLDLVLEADGRLLLVSGPNMGGKTVLLKTVGLAVLLSHAGFPVPAAEGSEIPFMETVLVDLGDAQSVDQGLSTFAGHLRALAGMAAAAGPRTLLLADELGSGTDPEEGGALGRALLEHFAARGAWGVMTTHLGQLKRVAAEVPGIVNGSLEYDAEAMRPRYRFIPGVPGASHGIEVARRMEFPEAVMARAEALTPEGTRALERLLNEVQVAGAAMREETARLAAARAEAEAERDTHQNATEETRRSLSRLRATLTKESEALLAEVRELWQSVRHEAKRAAKSPERSEAARRQLADTERRLDTLQREAADAAGESRGLEPIPAAALRVGLQVRVADLGDVVAEVASLPDEDGRVALRRGSWNIQSHVSRLRPAGVPGPGTAEVQRAKPAVAFTPAEATVSTEVDLRGMDVDDALRAVDAGLDRAVMGGLGELRIIHGLGKGVLSAAVERHLKGHPMVTARRLGDMHEGGRGVTVATLR
jgi:DNA mismatch repair protein MutS2